MQEVASVTKPSGDTGKKKRKRTYCHPAERISPSMEAGTTRPLTGIPRWKTSENVSTDTGKNFSAVAVTQP